MFHTRSVSAIAAIAAVAAALFAGPVRAADNPQQNRMAACNKEAANLKGEERKAFMKECLSKKKLTQQEKMKVCNQKATGMTGEPRRAFMKECLSAD